MFLWRYGHIFHEVRLQGYLAGNHSIGITLCTQGGKLGASFLDEVIFTRDNAGLIF